MLRTQFIGRRVTAVSLAAAALLAAAPVSAKEKDGKESKKACMPVYSMYKSAAEKQQAGHLREAYELFGQCMESTTCAGLVPKCKAAYEKLSTQMPTVIPVVTDESGSPRVDVQVKMDGEAICPQLDGKAIPVDPGVHEFSFASGGNVLATEKILVLEGQRNRPIAITLQPSGGAKLVTATAPAPAAVVVNASAEPAASPAEPSSSSEKTAPAEDTATTPDKAAPAAAPKKGAGPIPYILGGAGLLGVASGVLLTYWGNKDNDQLGSCDPHCPTSSLNHIRTTYVAADISFGVGIAALGVAAYMFATSGSSEAPHPKSAYVVDVHPTPSGAFASVSGHF